MTPTKDVPWRDFAQEVLRLYQAPSRRPATQAKIRQVLTEVGSQIDSTRQLDPAVISDWMARHPSRKPWTRHSLLGALRAVCGYGAYKGYLENPFHYRPLASWIPADELDEGDEEFPRHRPLADVRALLAQADLEAKEGLAIAQEGSQGVPRALWRDLRLWAVVYTAAFTGAGNREILGLRLKDVDLVKGVIRFRSYSARKLKTGARGDVVGVNLRLRPVLDQWTPLTDGESLFPKSRGGGPWLNGTSGYKPLDQLKALSARAGIRPLTFLDIRHTVGTHAEAWGMSELELQWQLRHARRKTQRHYRHLDLEHRRQAAAKIRYD